jgi:coenzyme Q-binding protein COQ10
LITVDEATSSAPPHVCFQVAADVERWPEILPHYRSVSFQRKDGFATGVVRMSAMRDFGPIGYPTWWVSEMTHDAELRRIYYKHIGGVTRGMDVVWEVEPLPGGGSELKIIHEWDGPAWPLIGPFAAEAVIGPHFVSHIAGRTLTGVCRAAEAQSRQASQ